MRIETITFRNHNDFHWIGVCNWCGHRERYQDGYADEFYCLRVVPERICPACGLNCPVPTDRINR